MTFTARILRKRDDLPRYIVIPADQTDGRRTAFIAEVSLNDRTGFERNIRPWGKGSDVFFFNLTERQCSKAGVETGDAVNVRIEPHA